MTQVYEQKVAEGFENFGSFQQGCKARQPILPTSPPPPPPKIVALHPKKKLEENNAKLAALKESERRLRNSKRGTATPRMEKGYLARNLPASVRKAFTAKNRLLIPSHHSTPMQPLTKKNPRSIENTPIKLGESGSSIFGRSSLGFRKEQTTRSSSKAKKNFAGLFRRVANAVRRAVPSEQDSFAGETLL